MHKANLFEDLIEELRDENLLESTVMDLSTAENGRSTRNDGMEMSTVREVADSGISGSEHGFDSVSDSQPELESDFFRKRAIDEISSLQMVEHVLSAIEREHMKAVPGSYDDLEAKKALHRFLQVQSDSASADYAEAEFKLMHETEAWNSALSQRDAKISVSNLRRFCENSRPVLSSQALMALGRFYRNATYSDLSRSKFDLVMTRLFSRDAGDERRRLLFSRDEMVGHLQALYANWASVALYSTEETSSRRTRLLVTGIEERIAEAVGAVTFEQLIRNEFFAKVHEFKEAAGEMFFTPEIVAATIDCNVRIGNKFVDLVQAERALSNPDTVEQRYGYEYDQIISDAAGKTLHLVELLKNLPEAPVSDEPIVNTPAVDPAKAAERKSISPLEGRALFKVNKWLLAATLLVISATGSLYFWSNQPTQERSAAENAKSVDLADSGITEYVRSGRASAETLYAITLPAWDQLSEGQKRDVVGKALTFANQQKLKRAKLLNVRGDAEAFASGNGRTDIYTTAP